MEEKDLRDYEIGEVFKAESEDGTMKERKIVEKKVDGNGAVVLVSVSKAVTNG